MGEVRKVYLPKWMTWFGLVMIVPMWGWVTYRALFTEAGRSDLGIVGWIVMTVVFVVFAAVLVLMGRRTLPAYLVEVEDEEEHSG